MNITAKSIVGELVAADYRTATVFKNHKIDFCCKGNRTIDEVCNKNQLDTEQLIEELKNETNRNSSN